MSPFWSNFVNGKKSVWMACEKALLFYFYPKVVGWGKKRVVEQFGLRTAAQESRIWSNITQDKVESINKVMSAIMIRENTHKDILCMQTIIVTHTQTLSLSLAHTHTHTHTMW